MSIEHTIDATRRAASGAVKEIKRLDDEIARRQAVVDAAMDWWHEEPGWSLRLADACRAIDRSARRTLDGEP